jgi:hypothetical protein
VNTHQKISLHIAFSNKLADVLLLSSSGLEELTRPPPLMLFIDFIFCYICTIGLQTSRLAAPGLSGLGSLVYVGW